MSFKIIKDVKYGSSSNQDCDLLLPSQAKSALPMVVLLHGGAWVGSKKEDFQYFAEMLTSWGYAVLNTNYRLVPQGASCQDMLADIDHAIRYAIDRSAEWGISSSPIALAGCSAGAHLALLYAYKGISPVEVKLILNMVGPSDLLDPAYFANQEHPQFAEHLSIISLLAGVDLSAFDPSSPPKELKDISPVYSIGALSPKTISAYGKKDMLVPYSNGITLDKRLKEIGGCEKSSLFIYENSDHSLAGDPDTHSAMLNCFKEELSKLLPIKY